MESTFWAWFALIFCLAKGLGCFRDKGRRAISTMEGRSRLLNGHYRRRRYAIQKCAAAAKRRGYGVFAIQHGGWCASAKHAYRTYRKYGTSRRCRNGKGGPWANDVYVLRGTKTVPLILFFSFSLLRVFRKTLYITHLLTECVTIEFSLFYFNENVKENWQLKFKQLNLMLIKKLANDKTIASLKSNLSPGSYN